MLRFAQRDILGAFSATCRLRGRILLAQGFNSVDQSGHARHGVLFAFVLGGHIALVSSLGEELPYTVEVDGPAAVSEAVANVGVSGVGDAGLDLGVLLVVGGGQEV